jgi:hypothetical protein
MRNIFPLTLLVLLAVTHSSPGQSLPNVTLEPAGEPVPFGPNREIRALALSPQGTLLLLDTAAPSVLEMNHGEIITEAGGFGFGDDGLRGPTDLCAARFEIWVADPAARRIVRFDNRFASLPPFGEVTTVSGSPLVLQRPVSVARGPLGDVVLVDADRSEALIVDSQGRLAAIVAAYGETGRRLISPNRVEISQEGNIAVTDPGSGLVFLSDRFGTVRRVLPWKLEGDGPTGLAWQGKRLWVCGESGIALYSERGSLIDSWPSDLVGGVPIDLAASVSKLSVLTAKRVRTFNVRYDTETLR